MLVVKHGKAYNLFFKLVQLVLRIIFNILFRTEIYGIEKIPSKGEFILCCNHLSYVDPLVIGAYIPRCIYFMAKIELFKVNLIGSIVSFFNAYPIDRGKFARGTLNNSLKILENGNVIGIFPEGTRSTDGILREAKKGVGFIAILSKSPIIPVAISGTNKIIQKPHKRMFFPKIKIIIGEKINTINYLNTYPKNDVISKIADTITKDIKSLYALVNK